MVVSIGTVTKRVNSTRLPVSLTDVIGQIVEPCDVVTPVIKFFERHSANYAYIADFGRYYWVDEWTLREGFWYASMHCDVLATYRSDIGNTSRYVLRAAADHDGTIVDLRYPTKTTHTTSVKPKNSGWSATPYGGSYIVGVIAPGGTFGSTAILCLDSNQFEDLRNSLMVTNDYYQPIQDQDLKNLAITMSNPMQYITFCKYYPFHIASGAATNIKLGTVTVPGMSFLPDSSLVWTLSPMSFDLVSHPEASIRGTYLNVEPFTKRYISFEPLGYLQIPCQLLQGETSFTLDMMVDVMSGSGKAVISKANGTPVYRTNFSSGVDIPLAQLVTNNPIQIISGVVNLAGGLFNAFAGNAAGAIGGLTSGISDFVQGALPEVQAYKAGSGSLLQNELSINLVSFFQDIVDEDNSEFGRPLCEVRQLSTLAGYQLVRDGDIGIAGTSREQEQIRSYLESGYFYE